MGAHPAARQPLLTLLAELQRALHTRFEAARQAAPDDGRGLRALQLGVELLCKLEEQLLHPALSLSRAAAWPALGQAMEEVDQLRDASALFSHTIASQGAVAMATLEGMAQRHFSALNDLLHAADAAAMPWATLEAETRALLQRWQGEMQRDGEVEDEDRDPVGTPPR